MNRSLKYCFLVIATGLFVCCGGGSESDTEVNIPENILSEERFAKVLADFALAEGATNLNVKNVPIQRFDTVYAFDPLKENGVRPSQYDSTLSFYAAHVTLYEKAYESALALLSEMQTRRDSLRRDSVAR
jgi:hypothetical protein